MGLFNWGPLPKGQTDPTTIDQAISLAINAHESDPASHMGIGESIDVHRKNDVLDHPKSSVVADKVGSSDIVFSFPFESINYFPDSLSLLLDYASQPYFYLEYGYQNNAYLEFSMISDTGFYNENKIMTLSFSSFCKYLDGHLNGYFKYGELRFVVVNDVLKARFYRGSSYNEVSLSSISLSSLHIFKIIYIPIDDTAYFYVDGVQVASVARPTGSKQVLNVHPEFNFSVSGGADQVVNFSNVSFSRSF